MLHFTWCGPSGRWALLFEDKASKSSCNGQALGWYHRVGMFGTFCPAMPDLVIALMARQLQKPCVIFHGHSLYGCMSSALTFLTLIIRRTKDRSNGTLTDRSRGDMDAIAREINPTAVSQVLQSDRVQCLICSQMLGTLNVGFDGRTGCLFAVGL
ncbi:hypothetical protein GGS21DRAFT_529135, partial [Xylaria nigripes]